MKLYKKKLKWKWVVCVRFVWTCVVQTFPIVVRHFECIKTECNQQSHRGAHKHQRSTAHAHTTMAQRTSDRARPSQRKKENPMWTRAFAYQRTASIHRRAHNRPRSIYYYIRYHLPVAPSVDMWNILSSVHTVAWYEWERAKWYFLFFHSNERKPGEEEEEEK